MGSTCCFRPLSHIPPRFSSPPFFNPSRTPRFKFGASQSQSRNDKRLSGFVCLAVDDDLREKQQELSERATGVGSAIEDRPGKAFKIESLTSIIFFFLFNV